MDKQKFMVFGFHHYARSLIFFYFLAIIDLFNVTLHFKFINYIGFFIIGDIIFSYKEFCKRYFM